MSRQRYPQLYGVGSFRDTNNKCLFCGTLPTVSVRIKVSWFRGEDEFEHVCNTCSQPRQTLANRIQRKWEAKYQQQKAKASE